MKKRIKLLAAMFVLTYTMTACQNVQSKDSSQVAESSKDTAQSTDKADSTADSTQKADSAQDSSQKSDSSDSAKKEDDKDYTTGKPWLDPEVPGNVTAETPTDPKDNYILYANKDKILKTKIQKGQSSAGTMQDAVINNNKRIMDILKEKDENAEHGIKLARDYYELWLDWDKRNELGMTPLKETIDEIEAIQSLDDLSKYMETPNYNLGYTGLFTIAMQTDVEDSSKSRVLIRRTDTLYDYDEDNKEDKTDDKDSSEQKADDKDSSEEKADTKDSAEEKVDAKDSAEGKGDTKDKKDDDDEIDTENLEKGLKKYGYSEDEVKSIVKNTLQFEQLVKDSMMSATDKKKPDAAEKMNNRYDHDGLLKLQGKLPILQHIQNCPCGDQELVIVEEPKWFDRINEIYKEENLQLFKDWFIAHAVSDSLTSLDRECYEWASMDEETKEIKDDEEAAADETRSVLDNQVAKAYCQRYCDPADRDRVTELINQLKDEYVNIIDDSKFISDETKKYAKEKLSTMIVNSLYPDDWSYAECDTLNFKSKEEGGTYADALKAISKYSFEKTIKTVNDPVKRGSWDGHAPIVTNCAYSPQDNSINILAAFAKDGIYDPAMSTEELYAKLGTVIGHEISHAFDSMGSQYDAEGNKKNWWTDEDKAEFRKRNENIVKYFNNIELWEGQKENGEIVTGEACADMGGMAVALRMAKKIDGFDYDKFFKAYADLWLNVEEADSQAAQADGDEHPISYLRINTVLQQFDEFLDLYDIKEGDNMYLAPEDRIKIWY